MRYVLAARQNPIGWRCGAAACAVASVIVCLAASASADTFYRWRDSAGQWHFSNRPERVPEKAQAISLRPLSVVQVRAVPDDADSGFARVAGLLPPAGTSECTPPDPSRLIDAITARLDSTDRSAAADLALFVGGVAVSYSSDSVVAVMAGRETDGAAASDQAAIAYPSGGACPRTPPLERYAASAPAPSSSSGLCADYRGAAVEIDGALARNAEVARPFVLASNRPADAAVGQPAWLMDASAAQTAELAAEIDEFNAELTVAHEEIESAAHAQGCW
jgi:hypothetical protein